MITWFAPAVVIVLFSAGAFLYATGDPATRNTGKNHMLNSLAGLFLVIVFLGMALALVPDLTIDKCLGESEKTCESIGGKCGCPAGTCKEGSLVTDVSDCPDTCCRMCEAAEKTCTEYGYVCGDCPSGKKCVESKAPGCESGIKCCECVEEETCEGFGLTCGCASGELCVPGTEKEDVGNCAKCCRCIKPCSSDTFGTKCCVGPSGLVMQCKAEECHANEGCHYYWRPALSYETCHSCCAPKPIKTCDQYLSEESCTLNPCALSKGGWVETACFWTECDIGATTIPCCKAK